MARSRSARARCLVACRAPCQVRHVRVTGMRRQTACMQLLLGGREDVSLGRKPPAAQAGPQCLAQPASHDVLCSCAPVTSEVQSTGHHTLRLLLIGLPQPQGKAPTYSAGHSRPPSHTTAPASRCRCCAPSCDDDAPGWQDTSARLARHTGSAKALSHCLPSHQEDAYGLALGSTNRPAWRLQPLNCGCSCRLSIITHQLSLEGSPQLNQLSPQLPLGP